MSGIYLDHSIVEQIKICFKHCTYMCCKVINQCLTARIPQQNSFACLAYTLITVLQSKEKICFGHGTNLCRKIINQSMPNSEDCLAKKLTTSGIYLDYSILDKRKNYSNHCTYMCCKILNQSLPNSEDSSAKRLCTSGIYLDHSIVEQRKNFSSIAPTWAVIIILK